MRTKTIGIARRPLATIGLLSILSLGALAPRADADSLDEASQGPPPAGAEAADLPPLGTPSRPGAEPTPLPPLDPFDRDGPEEDRKPPRDGEGRRESDPVKPPEEEQGRSRITFEAEAMYIPALSLWKLREEKTETNDPDALRARVHSGEGGGFRLGVGSAGEAARGTIGLLYLYSTHFETVRRTRMDLHAVFAEALGEFCLPGGEPFQATGGIGVGVGGFVYDFAPRGFHDEGGAAFEVRLLLGARILDHVTVRASGGSLVLGYPGETLGQGFFGTLEVGISF